MGVLGGAIAIYLCLVGIVPVFADRPLIVGVVSLGQAALLVTFGVVGFLAGRRALAISRLAAVLAGALAGAITGAFLTALVLIGSIVDLRAVFLNASPELYALLQNGLVFTGPVVPTRGGPRDGRARRRARGPARRGPVAAPVGHRIALLLRALRRAPAHPAAHHAARRGWPGTSSAPTG